MSVDKPTELEEREDLQQILETNRSRSQSDTRGIGGGRSDRRAAANAHSELASKVKYDYNMWSPSTRKKVRRNGTGLSQSFSSEINSSMMPYNDIAMAREARESLALQKKRAAQGKFKLFKRKLGKKPKTHAQQQALLDPADLEFDLEEMKEAAPSRDTNMNRKKSKRKKAANESSLRSELSEAFDAKASDPIHVNNLRFG